MTGLSWMRHAACRHPEADPEAFFPNQSHAIGPALAWCRDCPVTVDCLTYALSVPRTQGVWGGRLLLGNRKSRAKAEVGS